MKNNIMLRRRGKGGSSLNFKISFFIYLSSSIVFVLYCINRTALIALSSQSWLRSVKDQIGVEHSLNNQDKGKKVQLDRNVDYSLEDPDNNAPWPRIAWLMSFPNSGTSFTMHIFRKLSNHSAGTNYEHEALLSNNIPVPVNSNSTKGPYWEVTAMNHTYPSKNGQYVLVKTHCGGRCISCPPSKYIETLFSFDEMCRFHINSKGKNTYSPDIVQRTVHLIRDPINNIVSRFHHDYHQKYNHAKNKTAYLEKYSNSIAGFQKWCREQDMKYGRSEVNSRFIPKNVLNLLALTRCHGEFFRYVQWHNLAIQVREWRKTPSLIIHYEDYHPETFNQTADYLLNFLGYTHKVQNVESDFIVGKNYHDFFSPDQRQAIWKLIRALATPDTWELIERYEEKLPKPGFV